jgi:hypothetical protein
MNDLMILREAGPDGAALDPAVRAAARSALLDEISAAPAARRRIRRPGRRTTLRVGTALVAVAAAWTAAVAVTGPDVPSGSPSTLPTGPGTTIGTGEITLVAAEEVTFPLSLDPEPEGLTATFSRWGGTAYYADQPLVFSADYSSPDGDRFLLRLFPEDPRNWGDAGWSVDGDPAGTATVDAAEADVRRGDGLVSLLWERPDGRWVQVLGEGSYARSAALVAVAESVVDRPRPVGLQFGLAPAGWSVGGYEESRSLDLVSDTDPGQSPLRVSLQGIPGGGATMDTFFQGRSLTGAVEPVTVQGLPGRLALTTPDDGDSWLLVGQLPDGPLLLVVAPPVLTREQVLQIAEGITYTA